MHFPGGFGIMSLMAKQQDALYPAKVAANRRDALLLKLLETLPQPRPKRERVTEKPT